MGTLSGPPDLLGHGPLVRSSRTSATVGGLSGSASMAPPAGARRHRHPCPAAMPALGDGLGGAGGSGRPAEGRSPPPDRPVGYFLEASKISPKSTQRSPSNRASCSCSTG